MSKEHLNPDIQNISNDQILPDDQILHNQILPDDLCSPENEIPIPNDIVPDILLPSNDHLTNQGLVEQPISLFQQFAMGNINEELTNPNKNDENDDIVHLDITDKTNDNLDNQEKDDSIISSTDNLSKIIDSNYVSLLPEPMKTETNETQVSQFQDHLPTNSNELQITPNEKEEDNIVHLDIATENPPLPKRSDNNGQLFGSKSTSSILRPTKIDSDRSKNSIAKSKSIESNEANWVPKDDVQEQQDLHKKIDRLMSPERKRTSSRYNHKRKEVRSPLFITDETQPIDMPPDLPNIEVSEIEKSTDLATAPNERSNHTDIQVDIDEANDVIQLYSVGDEKKQFKTKQTPKTQQRPVRTSYQSRTPPRPPRFSSNTSLGDLPPLQTSPEMDSKMAELLCNFEKRGKIPEDPEMRPKLIQYMQRQKVNALVRHKYDEAQRYQSLTTKFMNTISKKAHDEEYSEKMSTVEEKVGETDVRIKNLKKETQALIREEKERQTQRRISLKITHKEELKAFEAKWNNLDYLQTFAKPSPYLFQLQKIERSMILTKMYGQAEETRKKITQAEKEESRQAQEKAVEEMEKQQTKILSRQQQEMEAFEHHCIRNIEIIKRNQELKMESILSRRSTLEKEKVMIQEGQKNSLPTIIAIQNPSDGSIEQTMTPRTANRYAAFKAQNKGPSLTVKPLGKLIAKRRNRLAQSAPATDL